MRSLLDDVMTGIFAQRGLFIYISGQMYEVITPVFLSLAAYEVLLNSLRTPGAAVKTVGITTYWLPNFLSEASTLSVQSLSCWSDICGQPMKQSFGFAFLSFQMTG